MSRAVTCARTQETKTLAHEGLHVLTSTPASRTVNPAKIFLKGVSLMEPTKDSIRTNLPSEAIELYNLFIHGVISRRAFMTQVQKFAIGGLTVGMVVESLMPQYAQAQQVAKNDDRIKATYETISSPQGNGKIKGYFVRPASADTRDAMPAKLPGI